MLASTYALVQALSALRVTEGNALVKILNLNLLNPKLIDAPFT